MTDQTKWGIDMVQQENKARAYEDQKEMRDDLAFYVLNCGVYQLQKMIFSIVLLLKLMSLILLGQEMLLWPD